MGFEPSLVDSAFALGRGLRNYSQSANDT